MLTYAAKVSLFFKLFSHKHILHKQVTKSLILVAKIQHNVKQTKLWSWNNNSNFELQISLYLTGAKSLVG